jgi:hypothetical protein
MSSFSEDKLLSVLAEIQSDIRQIKSELRALLTLLQHQQKPTSAMPAEDDRIAEPTRSGSASPEEVLRYLRETRGEDYTGE